MYVILLSSWLVWLLIAWSCSAFALVWPGPASPNQKFYTYTRRAIAFKVSVSRRLRVSPGEGNDMTKEVRTAMQNARDSASRGLSPGAGLDTAEDQAEAAFADLIITSLDQRGIDKIEGKELEDLARGGNMWENGSTTKVNKLGLLGDAMELFKALAGGAHIEKNEFGET